MEFCESAKVSMDHNLKYHVPNALKGGGTRNPTLLQDYRLRYMCDEIVRIGSRYPECMFLMCDK